MKLTNEYLIIAKDASVDANDQTVTLYKIIDNFTFGYKQKEFDAMRKANPDQPIMFPVAHTIASSWKIERPAGTNVPFSIHTKLVDPEERTLSENSQEAFIAKDNDKVHFNINTQAMPVTLSGKYRYDVSAVDDSGKEMARGSILFNVILKAED
jgi:hypothetical protein